MSKKSFPTVFVIFGITGDLVKTKIAKSLFSLYKQGKLPKLFYIYGFSRRNMSNGQIQKYFISLLKNEKPSKVTEFVKNINYVTGKFSDSQSYENLSRKLGKVDNQWNICANKLFYLATPPKHYETILHNLKNSGLTEACSDEDGWTRVILEKPFGYDLKSAKITDKLLAELFQEEQIYRVDHYLAKETVRNILTYRFSNSYLQPAWNNKYIEKIEVKVLEKDDIGDRGEFYDSLGALRDVGQNHLLQLLSLFTIVAPEDNLASQSIRVEREKAIKRIKILSKTEIIENTVRGQYEGYRRENNVRKNSNIETYFKIKTEISRGPLQGVKIILESGKALGKNLAEIKIHFQDYDPYSLHPEPGFHNILKYEIHPRESIAIRSLLKKPGHENKLIKQDFVFDYSDAYKKEDLVDAYEQLLLDIIMGDQTRFVSTKEVMAQWSFVEPILNTWKNSRTHPSIYKKGKIPDLQLPEKKAPIMNKEIGVLGLGKMGSRIARHLLQSKWKVYGYNRTQKVTSKLQKYGLSSTVSVADLAKSLSHPRVIWIMLPAGKPIDHIIFNKKNGLIKYLQSGDIIVDAGNSHFKNSIKRAKKLAKKGINFIDVGVSGGPKGALNGASMMVGGSRKLFDYMSPLYSTICVPRGFEHFNGSGAGHLVKMIHNGIEYGMMQSIAEGFNIMRKSKLNPDLKKVVRVYNKGSVIESRLIGWLSDAFDQYTEDLKGISGSVDHTGEGEWTIKLAKEQRMKTPVIKEALKFRVKSKKKPSYTGKILTALREQFGGHSAKEGNK